MDFHQNFERLGDIIIASMLGPGERRRRYQHELSPYADGPRQHAREGPMLMLAKYCLCQYGIHQAVMRNSSFTLQTLNDAFELAGQAGMQRDQFEWRAYQILILRKSN